MAWHVQIAVRRPGGADADGLVGQLGVEGGAVGLGKDGHGGDAQLPAGADDPHGDLAPVGDEDLTKHGSFPQIAEENSAVTMRLPLTVATPLQKLTPWTVLVTSTSKVQGVAGDGLAPEAGFVDAGEKGDLPPVFRQGEGADGSGLGQHFDGEHAGLHRLLREVTL